MRLVDRRRPDGVLVPGRAGQHNVACGRELLRRGLGRLGLRLTPTQHEALDVYLSELLRWASQVNLTGLRSEKAIVREGFLRSLGYRAAFEPSPLMKAIDVGSGAGFPGLVLKICFPEIDMLLIEPRRRRATFLRSIVRRLGLTGVRCVAARAEQLHGNAEHQGRYNVVFARAVGPLPNVVRMVEPLLAPGGRLILLAGRTALESLQAARPLLAILGMKAEVREAPAPEAGLPPTQLLIVDKLPPQVS